MPEIGPDSRLARYVRTRHSVFVRSEAVDLRFTPKMILHRRRRGRWDDMHRGVYRIAGSPETPEQKAYAATLASGGWACDLTGAALWKLEGIAPPDLPEVLVPHRRRIAEDGFDVHRTRLSLDDLSTRLGVIPITNPALTVVQIAPRLRDRVLEPALDDALRRLTTLERILGVLDLIPVPGRHGLGGLIEMLEARTPGEPVPAVLFESLFLGALRRHGIKLPECQFPVWVDGVLYLIDHAYPEEQIMVELDGYGTHGNPLAFEDDRERQNKLVGIGWRPYRVTWQAFTRDEERVCLNLDALLKRFARDLGER